MSGIECAFFGALGRNAEQKVSQSGKTYLRLSLRVGDGDDVQWITVLAFNEKAFEAGYSFLKGACVYCEGKLSTSKWTDHKGEKRLSLSVMSWHCRLSLIGRNKSKAYHSPRSAPAGRLPDADNHNNAHGNHFFDDPIPFAPEVR